MELRTGLRTTGSVRRFTDRPVDAATVHSILDTARFAPSGGNRQPWRVAVVQDLVLRQHIADHMQPVWDEYIAARATGQAPFNPISYAPPSSWEHAPYELLDRIDSVPVVLVVAADLRDLAVMDLALDRASIVGGGSIYPFCWSVLLAAHDHGLAGVLTTFLAHAEDRVRDQLGLPDHHGIAATIFLGEPEHRPTKLSRRPVEEFATLDRFDGPPLTT